MLWIKIILLVVVFAVVFGLFWVTQDYRKWVKWYLIRKELDNASYILPRLVHKNKEYIILGVNKDGSYLTRRLDTDAIEVLYYNQVKLKWD